MPIHDRELKAHLWRCITERFSPYPVQCVFCNCLKGLTLDHIVPTASGGSDDPENLQPLCRPCHAIKNTIREIRLREMVLATRGKENNTSCVEERTRLRTSF